jgi:hypothetical protein
MPRIKGPKKRVLSIRIEETFRVYLERLQVRLTTRREKPQTATDVIREGLLLLGEKEGVKP